MTNLIKKSLKANNCFFTSKKSYISREFQTWQMHGLAYCIYKVLPTNANGHHYNLRVLNELDKVPNQATVCFIFLVKITAVYDSNWANWNF